MTEPQRSNRSTMSAVGRALVPWVLIVALLGGCVLLLGLWWAAFAVLLACLGPSIRFARRSR